MSLRRRPKPEPIADQDNPDLVYVHIGTGRTPSIHFCTTCDGYYGVPHNGPDGPHSVPAGHRHPGAGSGCACRPCQVQWGRFPSGGVFVPRAERAALMDALTPALVSSLTSD